MMNNYNQNIPRIREVTKSNLKRILEKERIGTTELAQRYGTTKQSIQTFLDYGFGEKVAEGLGRALGCPWSDFYRLDYLLDDLKEVSNEIIQLLLDVRKIMERRDDFLTRLIKENVKFMLEYISTKEYEEMLEKRVSQLEQKAGIRKDEAVQGRVTGSATPHSKGRKEGRSG